MIEQTYFPFGGETSTLPTLSGSSSFITSEDREERESSGWLGWLLLIATLIGIAGLVYWWRSKRKGENPIEEYDQ